MDILERVKQVVSAEPDETQLDKFLSDLRESLAASNRQFLGYQALIIGSVITYQLIVYGKNASVSFNSVQLTDTSLFRRAFLSFPAALMAAQSCVGYLRRAQREVFDYLTISR